MNLLQIVKATGDAFIARAVESVKTDAGTTVDSRVNLRTSEDRIFRYDKVECMETWLSVRTKNSC